VEYLVKPWGHQLKGIDLALKQRDFALLMAMGTGKTATTINILRHRFAENKRILKTLIVCPLVMCESWAREFKIHSKSGDKVLILKGSAKERLVHFIAHSDSRPIVIVNYEFVIMKNLVDAIKAWGPEVLVLDESQRVKSHNSKRTKILADIAKRTKHNYILSGTPIVNSAMDIFGQYLILDRGDSFGDNFYSFRAKYFVDKNAKMPSHLHFPKWVEREEMFPVLNEKIYAKAMRVKKEDCLDLPPLIKNKIYVDLSPEQRKHYSEMKKHFITYIKEKACTAQIAVTKALRMQQIVSGFIKTEDGQEIKIKENPRLDALSDIVEDLEGKAIIWCVFKENYRQISELLDNLGKSFVMLTGEQAQAEKQESIDAFQNDPNVQFMIANQAAGGVGVTLTAAKTAIFYSRNFSLEQDLQAEARNYRGGSEIHDKILRIDIVAKDSIDSLVEASLARKQSIADNILQIESEL
jgi:SNF2 family DNA or RNA helicase